MYPLLHTLSCCAIRSAVYCVSFSEFPHMYKPTNTLPHTHRTSCIVFVLMPLYNAAYAQYIYVCNNILAYAYKCAVCECVSAFPSALFLSSPGLACYELALNEKYEMNRIFCNVFVLQAQGVTKMVVF